MIHPDFAMGYYFLGYGYANMGLYTKASLTWESFIELTAASVDFDYEVKSEDNSTSDNTEA